MTEAGKKILVICDRIPPEHSATGKIAFHIAKELAKDDDISVACLASGNNDTNHEGVYVFPCLDRYGTYQKMIKASYAKKGVSKALQKIKYKLYYKSAERKGLFEVSEHEKKLIEKCRQIINEKRIDTVISVSNPFACHRIAYKLKTQFPTVKWYAHLMDSNRHNAVNMGGREEEIKLFSKAEKLFIMPALTFDKDFCNDFKDKIKVVNLPIIPINTKKENTVKTEKTVFVFAGMFYKEIRNPEKLFELFLKLPESFILRLHTKGCNDIIEKYKEELGERLEVLEFLPQEELSKSIMSSNILINIGNTVLNQVPSKVYEYMSYGKPILNLYQNKDDISREHLSKYPLYMEADYNGVSQTGEISKWCESVKDKELDYMEATEGVKEMRLQNVALIIHDEISN